MRRAPLVVLLLLAGCAAPEAGPVPLPDGVAVLGDSISRAMNADGERVGDAPQSSWATGADPADGVASHLERLRALQPSVEVVGFNDARSGARMSELPRQADEAVRQKAPYVLVLMGANDACARTVEGMTSEATFRAQFAAAADRLRDLPARAVVVVASVPDVTKLAEVYAQNETARAFWRAFDVCPSALGDAGDPAAVRARIEAYNAALAEESRARGFRWDEGRVFEETYEAEQVSSVDFFHPSLAGQARLAEITWALSPWA